MQTRLSKECMLYKIRAAIYKSDWDPLIEQSVKYPNRTVTACNIILQLFNIKFVFIPLTHARDREAYTKALDSLQESISILNFIHNILTKFYSWEDMCKLLQRHFYVAQIECFKENSWKKEPQMNRWTQEQRKCYFVCDSGFGFLIEFFRWCM